MYCKVVCKRSKIIALKIITPNYIMMVSLFALKVRYKAHS